MGIYKRRDNMKSCDLKKVMAFFVPGREFGGCGINAQSPSETVGNIKYYL